MRAGLLEDILCVLCIAKRGKDFALPRRDIRFCFYAFFPKIEQSAKAIRSAATTLAPLGVSKA